MTTDKHDNGLWTIVLAAIGLLLTYGGILVGLTYWVVNAIQVGNTQAITAIHLDENRITTLEIQQKQTAEIGARLTEKIDKLSDAENSLSVSVQILTDKLPDLRKR